MKRFSVSIILFIVGLGFQVSGIKNFYASLTLWIIGGVWLAVVLTNRLPKRFIKYDKNNSWVELKKKGGVYPTVPDYLLELVSDYTPNTPITKNVKIRIPSGQLWFKLAPSKREEYFQLAEWLGLDRRDIKHKMDIMRSKDPKKHK